MCSGFFSAVASGQEAHCKRALPHGSEQIPHAVAGHDAVADGNIQQTRGAAKMSGEGLAFSTSSPVKIGVSGGKFQPPVPSRSNKTAGISLRLVSTGGMWQLSSFLLSHSSLDPALVARLCRKVAEQAGNGHHFVCEQQYRPDWPSERTSLFIALSGRSSLKCEDFGQTESSK